MTDPNIISNITYRIADEGDATLLLNMIKELARYEKLEHEVTATRADIEKTVFGKNAKAFAYIAESKAETGSQAPAGFALCFYNYSTFQGKSGIYIEDLYVRKAFRGKGIGKGFFRILARRALEEDCGRLQWWVLDWNKPSIQFYESLGAVQMDEWTVMRIEGTEKINALARMTV